MKYGIVVSEFNSAITDRMLERAVAGFREQGIEPVITNVPGALEIPYAIQEMIYEEKVNAVLALGCIIQGETDHYQIICDMLSKGIMDLILKHRVPIIFEVLMTDSYKKAEERIEKAYEASFVATKLIN